MEKTKPNLIWSLEADCREAFYLFYWQYKVLVQNLNYTAAPDELRCYLADHRAINEMFYNRICEVVKFYTDQGLLVTANGEEF